MSSDTTPNLSHLNFDDLARRPLPGTQTPVSPTFSPNGRHLYYLFPPNPTSPELELHRLDVLTSDDTVVRPPTSTADGVSREEALRRERLRVRWEGITDVTPLAHGGRELLFLNQGGTYHLLDAETMESVVDLSGLKWLGFANAPEAGVIIGTDGTALYRIDLATKTLTKLWGKSTSSSVIGVAEYVAQEELERMEGIWVSPDGGRLAYEEFDESHIPLYPVIHYNQNQIEIEEQRYPFVGAPNAHVTLWVRDNDGSSASRLPFGDDAEEYYLARGCWLSGDVFVYATIRRDQQRYLIWQYDATTQASRVIYEETSPTWVNLPRTFQRWNDQELLTTTERTGFAHVVVIGTDGTTTPLTQGELEVTSVDHVAQDRGSIWITMTSPTPVSRRVGIVDVRTRTLRELSDEEGCHSVVVSSDGTTYLHTLSSRTVSPRLSLRHLDRPDWSVPVGPAPVAATALGLNVPELLTIEHDGITLHGALYSPSSVSHAPRPLVIYVYGGPHAQVVTDSWELTIDLQAQYLVQHGVAVFKLDGRGSYHRGKAFEEAIWKRFGTVELDDQLAGLDYLIAHHDIDPTRVGIFGWSYGGFMTLTALAKAPDRFAVGVAGAPVTDFALYDTAYTERYMQTPASNPEGYAEALLMTKAAAIASPVLLIHGLIDENVHFRHTALMLDALTEANVRFDTLVLPKSRHSPRGTATLRLIAEKRSRYLLRGLGVFDEG
jgi:dipeptidyl-peptidase-4